jgi:rfaE bifunctional protein kinase chain/domain
MTGNKPLAAILERMKGKRVCVIGDIMLDHYIWGDVHRISPEAPVPVVHAERDTYTAGGASNVAFNLANLGLQVSLLGYIGRDHAGNQLRELMAQKGIQVHCPVTESSTPTIIKTRVIVRNQQLCRIDREEAVAAYNIFASGGAREYIAAHLGEVDALIISDYAKGVITQDLLDFINRFAQEKNIFISMDPKPSRKLHFTHAGLLTPNRKEALQLAGLQEPNYGEPYPLQEACRIICEQYQPHHLVITLGADGMAICRGGKVVELLPTRAREVYDVSGAGDTVIAVLTAALVAGAGISEAATVANAAAACVVSHVGTAPVVRQELELAIAAI